jgi:hypothetical protein
MRYSFQGVSELRQLPLRGCDLATKKDWLGIPGRRFEKYFTWRLVLQHAIQFIVQYLLHNFTYAMHRTFWKLLTNFYMYLILIVV